MVGSKKTKRRHSKKGKKKSKKETKKAALKVQTPKPAPITQEHPAQQPDEVQEFITPLGEGANEETRLPRSVKHETDQLTPIPSGQYSKEMAETVANYERQLKKLRAQLAERDLAMWKVEEELKEAGITDMISHARTAVAMLHDEKKFHNVPYSPFENDESTDCAREAVAMLTEKLYLEREFSIDQKAFINLRVCTGSETYRLGDVVEIFKGRDIEAEELERLVRRWVNAPPNKYDDRHGARIWAKTQKKRIESVYGFS